MFQRTIAEKVTCTGIGLHTGTPVEFTLQPARPGTGVVFVRCDGAQSVEIPARPEAVSCSRFATTLACGEVTVGTVEHLLAALYGLGVDNVRVEVDGPEIPIMDGSAASFVYLIQQAGIFRQGAPRRILRIRRPLELRDGPKRIRVVPSRFLRISYAVDFAHPAIGRQTVRGLAIENGTFESELARARTFGFLHEVEALWRAGLGRGGSLENTVVLDARGVMNAGGLRWADEFVRHKALDLIGDLALLGMPLQGHVQVERGGHALHQRLVEEIRRRPDCWEVCVPAAAEPADALDLPSLGAPAEIFA